MLTLLLMAGQFLQKCTTKRQRIDSFAIFSHHEKIIAAVNFELSSVINQRFLDTHSIGDISRIVNSLRSRKTLLSLT